MFAHACTGQVCVRVCAELCLRSHAQSRVSLRVMQLPSLAAVSAALSALTSRCHLLLFLIINSVFAVTNNYSLSYPATSNPPSSLPVIRQAQLSSSDPVCLFVFLCIVSDHTRSLRSFPP